jgi:hypothetical protein
MLAGNVQGERAHAGRIKETFFAVDIENGKQVGWFAR